MVVGVWRGGNCLAGWVGEKVRGGLLVGWRSRWSGWSKVERGRPPLLGPRVKYHRYRLVSFRDLFWGVF